MLGSCARASDFFRIAALSASGSPHPEARIRMPASGSPVPSAPPYSSVEAHFAQ